MKTTKSLVLGILAITMAQVVQVQSQVPFTNSLVAYYPFNGNANDATGNGNNGQIFGNVVPATDRFENASHAYHFDGSASSAILVTNTLFNIGQAGYTISCWFATDNASVSDQVMLATIPDPGLGFSLNWTGTPNHVAFAVGPANAYWTDLGIYGDQTNFVNQTWYQVVLTKSGTSYTLYIDGQLSCQQTIPAASGYNYNVEWVIGSIEPVCTTYLETFLGRLDDFRFYNRALSSNEVQQLYEYESGLSCPYPATATATVVDGFVVSANITDGGCGYTNTPQVLIQGGGGTGATATAVVSNGVVDEIIITDAGIGYSNAPTIYIGYQPSIVTEPQSVAVNGDGPATFSVTAAGPALLSYQWSFNGTEIAGATSNTLTISSVVQTNLGSYAVVVSDPFGVTNSSDAVLSLMSPFLSSITSGGFDTYWGYSNTLSVQAWGPAPLSYQWYQNGVALSKATNQTLSFASIQFTNAGLYTVVVSNPLGSLTNTPDEVVVKTSGVSLSLYPGVTISGVVGYNYVIQRTADLSNTNSWVTVTNLTLTQPVQLWVDTSVNASLPGNPQQFYTVLPGQ